MIRDTVLPAEVERNTIYIGLQHIHEGKLILNGHGQAGDVTSLKNRFQTGDILFGKLRPYFRKVIRAPFNGICSTDIWVVRPSSENIGLEFLYYLMASQEFIDFATLGSEGTRMPRAKWEHISRFEINLPALAGQQAIAHILCSLDDKIELNRQMNAALEEMARALFKSWFVDFDPVRAKMDSRWQPGQSLPGLPAELYDLFPEHLVPSELGEIPEGWKVTKLGNLVETIRGRSYRSKELSDSDTALVTLKSFARGGGYRLDGLKPYIGKYKEQQIVKPGELIVAMTDVTQAAEVVGRPAIVQESKYSTLVVSLDCTIVRPRDDTYLSIPYLYSMAMTRSFNEHTYALTTGTTVLHLSRDAVPSFLLALPPKSIVRYFNSLSIPIFKRIANNISESETLASLRDSLLPKLLSGETRVDDLETIQE